MKITLEGKTALVTGGSRGIGLAIARGFAEHGAKVGIVSRKPENLEEARAELAKDGFEVETFAVHVGREGAAADLVRDAALRLGKIDVLVNNAATNPHFGPTIT